MKAISTQAGDEACAPRAETIARLNDRLRKHGAGGSIMLTAGVQALRDLHTEELLDLLVTYDAFDADNDPHGERDFGDLTLNSAELLWKIDYYETASAYGSPDPANPAVTRRVLTIMLADEY